MDGRRNFDVFFKNPRDKKIEDKIKHELKLTDKTTAHREDFQEGMDIEELEKTRLERKICADAISAVKKVLEDLKLKKFSDHLDLQLADIHIVSSEEMIRLDPEYGTAFQRNANAYVKRTEYLPNFIYTLTHELSHCASYQAHDIEYTDSETTEPDLQLAWRRIGLAFRDSNDKKIPSKFDGLMEATNEICADLVRKKFNEINNNITFEQKQELVSPEHYAYAEQIAVVSQLLDGCTANNQEYYAALDELVRNHITGSYSLLNRLEFKKPGVTKILAEMGTTPEDAAIAAEKLGFHELAEGIRNIIALKEEK